MQMKEIKQYMNEKKIYLSIPCKKKFYFHYNIPIVENNSLRYIKNMS